MRNKNQERPGSEAVTPRAPKLGRESSSELTNYIAIGFGVSATFLWTAIATLNSPGKPGAGVNLHVSAFVGLIGTAIGACVGLFINRLRR